MTVAAVAEPQPIANHGRWVIWLLGAVWVVLLAALLTLTANPLVVNRTQILNADTVVVATWTVPGKSLTIDRVLKGTSPSQPLAAPDEWPVTAPKTGQQVLPLSRTERQGWRITSGELPNPQSGKNFDPTRPPAYPSKVRPSVYPATPDVEQQIEQLLTPTK